MVVKSAYKQSEVGEIPEEWDVKSLREIGDSLIGLTYRPSEVRSHGTLVLRSSNVQEDALRFDDNVFVEKEIPQRIMVRRDDILICVRNGSRDLIGKSALIDGRAIGMTFGAFMAVFRSPHGRFIHYLVQSDILKRQINEHLGATINQITNKSLNSFRVPFPPDDAERQAIASTLGDVDALIRGTEQLIAKKRDLKQAAMQKLLTAPSAGGVRLPGFDGKWETKRLDELGLWKGGMTPSMRNPTYWRNGTVPWISSGDVKSALLTETGFSVTSAAVEQGRTTLLPENSIVIVARSGILRKYLPVAMNVIPMAINQDIKALIPAAEFHSKYLLHALIGSGDRILARCMKSGTTVESIELGWLKAFTIPVPSMRDEQIAIATVLSDMDAELLALEKHRDKARALKMGIMQELLTGKTRLGSLWSSHA